MTNYSENPGHVRVDRFKAGGKWYDTFMVDMSNYYYHELTPHDALIKAMCDSTNEHIAAIGKRVINGESDPHLTGSMFLVCLLPFHKLEYPVALWLK